MDYIVRATAADHQIRAFAATTKDIVESGRVYHNTSPVATAALGRLLTAGAMMSVMMKGEKDLLTLQIQCSGPIGGLTVTADSSAHVKGYVQHPEVMLPPNAFGKLDVGGALGLGVLSVIKDLGMKEPYVGQCELKTGEIGDDLTYTQMGKLHVGVPQGMDDKNLKAVVRYFESIGLPYKQEEDIILRMWSKFMLNVGINQTCMAFETDYAGCLAPGQAHDTFISAMKEVIRIADAEGVNLTEDAIGEYIEIVRSLKPDSIPSMRQDSLQKRRTEVDMFAGTVIRIAEKHGISVPANEFLYCRAKEIEASYHE